MGEGPPHEQCRGLVGGPRVEVDPDHSRRHFRCTGFRKLQPTDEAQRLAWARLVACDEGSEERRYHIEVRTDDPDGVPAPHLDIGCHGHSPACLEGKLDGDGDRDPKGGDDGVALVLSRSRPGIGAVAR